MYLTYVTAILNLNSTADMTFNWLFYDPLIYSIILIADVQQLLPSNQVAYLYMGFLVLILIKYFAFMRSVIS